MSTAPAPAAGAAAAPAAGAAPAKDASKSVPKEIRDRVLGARPVPPADKTPAEVEAERLRLEKEEADKKTAAEKKQKEEADKATAEKTAAADKAARVKKLPKDGPELPAAAAPGTDSRSIEQIVRDVLPDITKSTATAPAAPEMNPEALREIELAKFAERKNPERYSGFADKVTNYLKSQDELVAKKAAELGGQNTPEFRDYLESDEFRGWQKQHRPAYVRGDRDKLAEGMIADRARAEATAEMTPKLKELERKTLALEHTPQIEQRANAALNIIITDPRAEAERDPALDGFKKDPLAFGEAHPEEAQVIAAEASETVQLIREVYSVDKDLVDFDPKKRPVQATIQKFMIEQNDTMRAKHPNGLEMPDGKILIDAKTYVARNLDKDPRYRIFNADEMAGMLAVTANGRIIEKLQKRRVGVTKSVYAAKPTEAAPAQDGQKKKDDDEAPSPGAPSSSAPGTKKNVKTEKTLAGRYA